MQEIGRSSPHPLRRRRRQMFVAALTSTVVAAAVALVATANPAAAALPTWPANPNWQSLVPGPTSDDVRPVSVVRTQGSVTNAAALVGSGTTTLTTTSTASPAAVVLDFGKEVGGTPYVTVSGSTPSSNTVRISTSEALQFLTNSSGAFVNDNGSQISLTVTSAQRYTGGLRGGFRFAAIELRTVGTVSLTAAGLNFRAYRAGPAQYQGWFMSSDDQLNRMWYAGAYTTQMDMVPAGVASCFTQPVIFDGAKRDRAIWSGDLMITNPVAQLSLGTNSGPYVRGSINAIMNLQAANGRLTSAVGFRSCGIFDYAVTYSAYSAIIAILYYRYTGDTAYITSLLPRLRNATAYHATRLNANGLIVTNDNDYWQTTQSGEVTEYSLAYYELLQNMIWVEGQGRHGGQRHQLHQQGQRSADRHQLAAVQHERRTLRPHEHPHQRVPAGREHERDPPGRRRTRAGGGHSELLPGPVAGPRQPDQPAGTQHGRPVRTHHRAPQQHVGGDGAHARR